jgi:hypothetical protein
LASDGVHLPCDAFVAKLNAAGSGLVYSTYLYGSYAVTVMLNEVPAVTLDGPLMTRLVAAAGVTDTLAEPTMALVTVSVALMVCAPARLSVTLKVCMPESALVKV